MNGEFDFIERIRREANVAGSQSADLVCGIGDDTAILRQQSGRETLITVDLLVEEIDFRLEYAIPRWLGHKALAVSLSDIAAMGGTPRFALLTLGLPPSLFSGASGSSGAGDKNGEFREQFLEGYFALARRYGVALIGGDLSTTPEWLTIDSILLGECQSGRAIRRSGARVGDAVYLTGEPGASALGLELLLDGKRVESGSQTDRRIGEALRAHLRPEPRVEVGVKLGASGLLHAMIDVSDGVAQDLGHICEESGVSAIIDRQRLPLPDCLSLIGDEDRRFELAIAGGEDFELLFTAPREAEQTLREMVESVAPNLRLTRIGEIVEKETAKILLCDGSKQAPYTGHGFDHFRPND